MTEHDPHARVKAYFRERGPEMQCRVCGKFGVEYHLLPPNDNTAYEIGGWCSAECFDKDAIWEGESAQ